MDFEEKFIERYEELVVKNNYLKDKVVNLTRELEDKSRSVSILSKTTKCFNDFVDNEEIRVEYETFKDKWLAQEEQKNG